MKNKEEEHKEHIKKELKRVGQKAPKKEDPYTPSALEEDLNYLESLSDTERIEYLNILQSRAFFNPLKTDNK